MNRLYMSVFQYRPSSHANPVSALHGQKPLPDFLPVSIEGRTRRALQRLVHILPADPESTSGCVLFIFIYVIQRRANPQPHLFHSIRLKRKRREAAPGYSGRKNETAPSHPALIVPPSSARPPYLNI